MNGERTLKERLIEGGVTVGKQSRRDAKEGVKNRERGGGLN